MDSLIKAGDSLNGCINSPIGTGNSLIDCINSPMGLGSLTVKDIERENLEKKPG